MSNCVKKRRKMATYASAVNNVRELKTKILKLSKEVVKSSKEFIEKEGSNITIVTYNITIVTPEDEELGLNKKTL